MLFVYTQKITYNQNDSLAIIKLIELSDQHLWINYPEAKMYAHQALSESEDTDCISCRSAAISQLGKVYWYNGEYSKAIEEHLKALKIRQHIGDLQGMAGNFHYLALIYYYMADYQKA